jgi:hypothetical protein
MFFIRFCNSTLICAFQKEKIECKNKRANPPHVPKKLPAKNFRKNQADNKKQPFLKKMSVCFLKMEEKTYSF